ncbi:hypothetical protein [Maribellus mangrovi]|uniref:hypothetical protein n=1 Tax=Maribellus mangrovi TaxID=3133146 RepID=UPI0030EEA90A
MNTKLTIKMVLLFLFITLSSNSILSQEMGTESQAAIQVSENVSIAFMISVLVMKITAFIIGYLVVKLGHDTLVKGITGEFDFGFEGSGISTKLKSASPGTFFVLMGTAIIIWSMVAEKPLRINTTPATVQEITQTDTTTVEEVKDDIPD